MNNTNKYSSKINPVMKNKTVRTYSTLSFSIIAITIFSIFAIKPTIENIFALQKQIDSQSQILASLKSKSDKLAKAINNYNAIPEDTKIKLFTLLPNTPNPTCLIETLGDKTASSQVNVTGLQIQPFDLKGQSKCVLESADLSQIEKNNTSSSVLKEVPFTINATRDYPSLSTFLTSLKTSSRLVSIETALFNRSNEGPLVLSISGKAYYYK